MNDRIFRAQADSGRIGPRMAPFQRTALTTALAIAVFTMALIPIASSQWPDIVSFLPVYQATTVVSYAIVAYLIYGYFRQTRLHALLYLWGGCMYTSAILLVQFFSFPSAFVHGVRLLGGSRRRAGSGFSGISARPACCSAMPGPNGGSAGAWSRPRWLPSAPARR